MQRKNPLEQAERVIALIQKLGFTKDVHKPLLASAHYTLGCQHTISRSKAKMHINSAITLLQNSKVKTLQTRMDQAQAYSKRAEMLEKEGAFLQASLDYQRILSLF